MKHLLRWWGLLVFAGLLSSPKSWGQTFIPYYVDVAGGIREGRIIAESVPDTTNLWRLFDGNHLTEYRLTGRDSLVVTLEFKVGELIRQCKIYSFVTGKWLLEAADTRADLDSRTGSYTVLLDSTALRVFAWDSVSFSERLARFVRLRVKTSGGMTPMIGEWFLLGRLQLDELVIFPHPPRLLPATQLQLSVRVKDQLGELRPYPFPDSLHWSVTSGSIATVNESGMLTGVSVGTTEVHVVNDSGNLSGTTQVSVEADFAVEKVPTMNVKVALVLQDPMVETDRRIHEEFGWRDPLTLANRVAFHFREASDSVVNFQFVEILQPETLFTRLHGEFMSVSQFYTLLKQPNWTTLRAESDSGHLAFDYRAFVVHYGFDTKRNAGEIDEVWVFAAPWLAMYESQLMGPGAFWWNSPPIRDGTNLKKLLSVMGLNYERGVDQAFHSFGHRSESAIIEVYKRVHGADWNPTSANPTPWDLFTRIEKDVPGGAHVGNIHYPPNGRSDYDYGNTAPVTSYADNWFRYPYLLNQNRTVALPEWDYSLHGGPEPLAEGQDHIGYLRWWYGHLPRYVGVTEGVLNNWWHYILDFDSAMTLAANTPPVTGIEPTGRVERPGMYRLDQNYPNPFNPATTIRFQTPFRGHVSLAVFDLLGRQVADLVNSDMGAGEHVHVWEPRGLATGMYVIRLGTSAGTVSRKALLVK